MFRGPALLSFCLATVAAVPAIAQPDIGRTPTFGTLTLSAGFEPDPQTVPVTAGGRLNAETVDSDCRGSIGNAPDVRVNYTAGSFPLIFQVRAEQDTTLVINGPDGQWHCNDDSNGIHPEVRFDSPASGQYDVYVGHYNRGAGVPARLHVTELTGSPR